MIAKTPAEQQDDEVVMEGADAPVTKTPAEQLDNEVVVQGAGALPSKSPPMQLAFRVTEGADALGAPLHVTGSKLFWQS